MKNVYITVKNDHPTVKFAAEELKKYLKKLNCEMNAQIGSGNCTEKGITLGILSDGCSETDTVSVDIKGLEGTIKGSNPRSVLFAVYKYLEKLGVKWVRHGADGEFIPCNHDFSKDAISFTETAKYKHRSICIEGALSIENALDNIDWAAKMGFNEYYIQGILPTFVFKRWYEHFGNPMLKKRTPSKEEVTEYRDRMVEEIKKRDLIYHAVGHGWHSEPFGLTSLVDTENEDLVIPEDKKELLALIDGKRGLYNKMMAATHLCYSNPKARKGIVDYAVKYAKEHPETDMIFFPLADGSNNHCECEECSKVRPSDLYVKILNELDEALTKEKLSAKVVVALYCDYLWAPTGGKFNNPDRFIYVYAPFHRTIYLHKPSKRNSSGTYKDMGPLLDKLPPYERNKLNIPQSVEELISCLRSWQEWQDVDAFDHEYYYYLGEHYYDIGSVHLAKIIYDDIRELPKYKLNGMMTCQSQRAFMPTGIGSWVMAKALWDDEVPFDDMKKEFFDAAFGDESQHFSDYFTYLSKLAHTLPEVPFDTVTEVCKKMIDYIGTLDLDSMDECRRASINYTLFHCNLIIRQMAAEKITVENNNDVMPAENEWKELIHYVRSNELSVQSVFDLTQYFTHIAGRNYTPAKIWWRENI